MLENGDCLLDTLAEAGASDPAQRLSIDGVEKGVHEKGLYQGR